MKKNIWFIFLILYIIFMLVLSGAEILATALSSMATLGAGHCPRLISAEKIMTICLIAFCLRILLSLCMLFFLIKNKQLYVIVALVITMIINLSVFPIIFYSAPDMEICEPLRVLELHMSPPPEAVEPLDYGNE
ncbi:hypothetical protein [Neisseria sp. Ec49-e6-T10]|uniref:hypothetical protein n=1 Tax=Neisseria sp. Ec49-e6-T10 TaxID=3140744 RepID=UPI003EC07165